MKEVFQEAFDRITEVISGYTPTLLVALGVLIIGWLIALIVAAAVRFVLRRTALDNRLAVWILGEEKAQGVPVENWIARGVYWLVMLFVFVAFFDKLGLELTVEPVRQLLSQLFEYAPRILGAVLLLAIAWVIAAVMRKVLVKVLGAAKFDERVGKKIRLEEEKPVVATKTVGDVVYWLVFLLFLPAVLSTLALEGLSDPVESMMTKIFDFMPNILTGALILAVGWFVARVVRGIVANLFASAGADQFSERIGLAKALAPRKLSGLLGLIVYILILIPVDIAALDALALDAITQPASHMLDEMLSMLPNLFGALLLLAIFYVVGRVVSSFLSNLLAGAGFDALLARLGFREQPAESRWKPSAVVGYLVMVGIMLLASVEALRLMDFEAVADLLDRFLVLAGHVVLGLLIFGVGLYLSQLAARAVRASGAAQAPLLAAAARVSILVLAGAMALRETGLAEDIINLAFGIILGAAAVAFALAFGLGGRDIAARHIENWSQRLKAKKD